MRPALTVARACLILTGPYRFWQRRFYGLNVWSEKKRQEKLSTMHGNPVKRGLVTSVDQWPWSSYRDYFLEDGSLLTYRGC